MELARERLWAYAVVTLNAWCASGTIVERVRASSDFHGGFEMEDRHSDVLRADPEERIDLMLSAVAGAWPAFLEYGLRGGKWDPNWEPETAVADSRGSSAAGLRTYFTKGVLQYFPPVTFLVAPQRGAWPPGPVWLFAPCRTHDLGGVAAGSRGTA